MGKELKDVIKDEALLAKVIEALGETKILINEDNAYVPKTRLNEVISERDSAREQNESLTTSLEGLKNSTKDAEGMKNQLSELQQANVELIATHDKALKGVQFDSKFDLAVAGLNPQVSPVAVAALFDKSKISLDGTNLIGFSDQAAEIVKNNALLFTAVKDKVLNADKGKGAGFGSGDKNPFKADSRNVTKQIELKRKDLQLYNKLKAEAEGE